MSAKVGNNVTYSDKNWTDVINKYDLQNQLEVVVKEEISDPVTKSINPKSKHSWIARTLVFVGLIAVIGNIPVQSLSIVSSSNNNKVQSFEIKPNAKQINSPEPTTNDFSYELADNFSDMDVDIDELGISGSKELALPEKALETYAGKGINQNNSKWTTYHVKSYDNLTNIFHKVGHKKLLKVLKSNKEIYKIIEQLKKGSIVRASSTNGHNVGQLVKLFEHIKDLKGPILVHTISESDIQTFGNQAGTTIQSISMRSGRRAHDSRAE